MSEHDTRLDSLEQRLAELEAKLERLAGQTPAFQPAAEPGANNPVGLDTWLQNNPILAVLIVTVVLVLLVHLFG